MKAKYQTKTKLHNVTCEYLDANILSSNFKEADNRPPSYFKDIFNESAWRKTPQNQLMFSFERGFLTSSSRRHQPYSKNGGDISSFELESIETPDQGVRKFAEDQPLLAKVKVEEDQNLRKRKPEVGSFKVTRSSLDTANEAKAVWPRIDKSKPELDFTLNFSNNDDFESDSEQQAGKALCLAKSEVDKEDLQNQNLSFSGLPKEVQALRQVPLSKIIEFSCVNAKAFEAKTRRSYVCKYCAAVFHSGCALGGHISKIHRGVNFSYAQKMAQRSELKVERDRIKYLKQLLAAN